MGTHIMMAFSRQEAKEVSHPWRKKRHLLVFFLSFNNGNINYSVPYSNTGEGGGGGEERGETGWGWG